MRLITHRGAKLGVLAYCASSKLHPGIDDVAAYRGPAVCEIEPLLIVLPVPVVEPRGPRVWRPFSANELCVVASIMH